MRESHQPNTETQYLPALLSAVIKPGQFGWILSLHLHFPLCHKTYSLALRNTDMWVTWNNLFLYTFIQVRLKLVSYVGKSGYLIWATS